ncbi:helix-turn-helix transcriptional regulator [Enterococcus hirae]|nr:helix-turn-helix transcriptional regulator [Enterococcus hirae]
MKVNLGAVIAQKRKERKVTQQELADFLGVSKASVSKWENKLSYPDITLLPAIAAYFDLTIDSLMDYEPQLSPLEIQRIYVQLQDSLVTQPATQVLRTIRSLIRRYYACYPFLLEMGLLLLNHYDLLPGTSAEEKAQKYIPEARELFVRVRTAAKDHELINYAVNLEAYTLLLERKPESVLKRLGKFTPAYFPAETLIAAAYAQEGKTAEEAATYQSALFQYLTVMMSLFSNYLQALKKKPQKFLTTYQRAQTMIDTFDFGQLHPISTLNFYLSAATGFAAAGDKEATLNVLEKFAALYETVKFPVKLHGDAAFDQLDAWFDQLDLGRNMPRAPQLVESQLQKMVVDNPLFQQYAADERLQEINQKLKKEGNHHA